MKPNPNSRLDGAVWALLWLFVFSLPLEKCLDLPGFGTITKVVGLVVFAVAAEEAIRRRAMRIPNAVLLLAAAFVGWSSLTYFWSLDRPSSAQHAATLIQLLGMVWLIWERCRTRSQQHWLMGAYVAGIAVSSGLTIGRYMLRQQTYYRRYASPGFEPNDMGVTLALAIPLCLYLAGSSRGWRAWLIRAVAAGALAALLLTGSRTALVGAFLAFAYTALRWRAALPAQRLASAGLLLLLVLGTLQLAPQSSRQRLATLPTELVNGTVHDRTRIWKAGVKVLRRHWLRGVGTGAYPEAVRPQLGVPALAGHRYTAHNTFLSVLVETGLPGALLFGLLLATVALFTWILPADERALWFTMLAVWTAGASTLAWETRKPTWFLFALIMTAWADAFRPRKEMV